MQSPPVSIAIIDMYNGTPNIGMKCIHAVLKKWSEERNIKIQSTVFRVRELSEIPTDNFDMYISSGGPGSPIDSIEENWDKLYTSWLEKMRATQQAVLLICHSFQIACRHFELGTVSLRKSRQIGILPVHPLTSDSLFNNLQDPFYALESRQYQITEPNDQNINKIGAKIIALEKIRPQVPLERAIMAVQFSPKMYGVQFHPEAAKNELTNFFNDDTVKNAVIDEFGLEKWDQIMNHLDDDLKIDTTFSNFIPNFLDKAISG